MTADAVLPRLPDLRILARLGEGGMGTVYKGFDERMHRVVAVKVLAPRLAANPSFVARFLREARYLARVRHAGLVTVYDVVTAGATPYFVMEYVEGSTLAAHLETRGRLPWNEAWALLDPVLDAVAALHAAGLVHRDLKPANILLDGTGRPKVADFGLAKSGEDPSLTREGALLGTPEFMAPEQASDPEAGPPADVYALGVAAFQMASGRLPFRGEGTVATLRLQAEAPIPDLARLAPGMDPFVASWVARAMAKRPSDRFADAGAMRQAMLDHLGETASASTSEIVVTGPRPPHRGMRMLAAGAIGAAILVAGIALLKNRPASAPAARGIAVRLDGAVLKGDLLSIAPEPGGGHRIRLRTPDGERELVCAPGGRARIDLHAEEP